MLKLPLTIDWTLIFFPFILFHSFFTSKPTMKTSIFNYSLLWSGAAAAAVLQPRQFGSMKVEKPAKIVSVKPRYRETAKRDQIRFGPLTLPAAKVSAPKEAGHSHGASGAKPFNPLSILSGGFAMDPDGFAFGRQLEGGFCTDCTILAGKVDVVFENGTRADVANGVYLHHVISSITGKQPQVWASMCPKGATIALPAGLEKLIPAGLDLSKIDLSKILGARGGGAGFIGGAVDEFTDLFTSKDGKIDSGYYVPKNIKTTMSGEIINYLKEPQDVYIQFDIEYVPGRASKEAIKAALSVEGRTTVHVAPIMLSHFRLRHARSRF